MNSVVNKQAFSLVEVVLAIGVISFGLMVIIGLLPIGMKSNRDSTEENQAVNIMQAVIADRQGTDYDRPSVIYGVPAISGSNATWADGGGTSCYVQENGRVTPKLTADDGAIARYIVAFTLYSGTRFSVNGGTTPIKALMNIRVSWPAQQPNSTSAVETTAVFTAP